MARESAPLGTILNPTAVAIVGASDDPGRTGGRVVHNVINCGFRGRILPVNPHHESIFGLTCYPSIKDVPGPPPELAFVSIRAADLAAALAECASAGVRCCVATAVGFAEMGEAGTRLQEEIREIAQRTGMRLIGPNCLGLVTSRCQLNLTSGWTLNEAPAVGNIGLISQSGSMLKYLYHRAADLGSGISSGISIGNQVDLELSDFIEEMVEDQSTSVICGYVEGLRDAERFLHAADACLNAGKPLLILKVGRTTSGASIARSHTASLATANAVFKAMARSHGIILADDPDTMIATAIALERGYPQSGGVAILSGSGGGLATTLDRAVKAGLWVPVLEESLRLEIEQQVALPSDLAVADIGRRDRSGPPVQVGEIARMMASDPNVSAVIFAVTVMPYIVERTLEAAIAVRDAGKQFIPTLLPGSVADDVAVALRDAGFPSFGHIDEAIRFASAWTSLSKRAGMPAAGNRLDVSADISARLASLPAGRLTEAEAKQVLRWSGVTVNRGEVAGSAEGAVEVAERLGYPVAVKLVSRKFVHKSEVGGVKLNLGDAPAVRTACEQIRAAVNVSDTPRYFVQEMVDAETELIVGITRDDQFGPVVTVGFGGVFTELVGDVCLAPAPLSEATALSMLRQLKMWPLLAGARGLPQQPVSEIAAVISRLSWLAVDLGDRLVEFEINPLMCSAAGTFAVDARGTLA